MTETKRCGYLVSVAGGLATAVQSAETYALDPPGHACSMLGGALLTHLGLSLQLVRLLHDLEWFGSRHAGRLLSARGRDVYCYGGAVVRLGNAGAVSLWDLEKDGELVYSSIEGELQPLPPQLLQEAIDAARRQKAQYI